MDPRYTRSGSPGSRRLAQPGRSSTGSLVYPSPYDDPYHAPVRSSRDSIPGPSAERILAPSNVTRLYRDKSPPRRLQTDYIVPPRRTTLDPLVARRPLSVLAPPAPNRYRPVITSAIEKPSGSYKPRLREEEPHYLLPASSSRRDHHRTYSADHSDVGRYLSDGRERQERAGYRSSGINGRREGYNLNLPLVRQLKDDDDVGYEYTDRKEQMYRDTAPRPRQRRGSDLARRERPLSMTGLEDYPQRLIQGSRDGRPPVTTRGFDKLGDNLNRSGSLRHEYKIPREPDLLPRDVPSRQDRDELEDPRRPKSTQVPVALHQDRDVSYTTSKPDRREPREKYSHGSRRAGSLDRGVDDRGPGIRILAEDNRHRDSDERSRRHHERRSRRDRDAVEEAEKHHRSSHRTDRGDAEDRDRRTRDEPRKEKHGDSKVGAEAALGVAGLAAAGLAADGVRKRHHRNKDSVDTDPEASLPDRTRNGENNSLAVIPDPSDSSNWSGENIDEDPSERRRRRRERAAREEDARPREKGRGRDNDFVPSTDKSRRESDSYDRDSQYPPQSMGEINDVRNGRSHRRYRTRDEDSDSGFSSDDSQHNARQHKSSQVRVVSPARESKPEIKPKGILRPPREKFPEDPAPVREGVAPLKDAGKKGIPPNARWTKIDRRLVNPEALDQGNERYEERIDYVIVLRVLTKAEIDAYAQRTQEIRGMRDPLVDEDESAIS